MAIQIQFRRGTASEWTSVDPILAEGEMGIETDTNLFKIGNGNDTWTELPYGGLRGFVGSTGYAGSVGNISVANVLYVSKSGDDANSGTSLNLSKLTIKAALQIATNGTTIFVKSGDYTEINPLIVPEGVAIVGDNLRTVTVRPQNKTQDLFYVNNGAYLAHMTFKDHESPSAAVSFNPDGSAGVIHTSPYVQNCTSMTTTGTGMRVDGAHCSGLRSMVVDAFTQYNQGGIGIHHLNRGNTQLVSVFTICCDIAILCESGGFCSLTNSNSSFGNIGLKADGVSSTLYSGKTNGTTSGRTFVIDNLTTRPNVGDAVKFTGDNTYYTLATSTAFTSGSTTISSPSYAAEPADARNARQNILDVKSKIQVDVIDFLNETYPSFDFNQFKCSRDVGLIIDAVVDDMVLNTNYKSIQAGISYYRATASEVTTNQKTETIAGINFARDAVLEILSSDSTEYTRVQNNFNTITDIINNGIAAAPSYTFNNPTGVDTNKSRAKTILQANRNFFIEEGIAYITANYAGLSYDSTKCRRDIGYIIDSVTYDTLYGGNSQTADAADEYYSSGTLQVPTGEKQATIDTFAYLKTVAADCLVNTSVNALNGSVSQDTSNPAAANAEITIINGLFDIVTNLIENAYSSTITLEETATEISDNAVVTFHQFSLITAAGQTFEWVGAGTNVNTALPYLGGIPITENQVVQVNQGKIYYTGTDQRGDFRIGDDLVINRNTGTITGRTFTKSLFAVMTPYILAIGD
jgi:hypothetical protein